MWARYKFMHTGCTIEKKAGVDTCYNNNVYKDLFYLHFIYLYYFFSFWLLFFIRVVDILFHEHYLMFIMVITWFTM